MNIINWNVLSDAERDAEVAAVFGVPQLPLRRAIMDWESSKFCVFPPYSASLDACFTLARNVGIVCCVSNHGSRYVFAQVAADPKEDTVEANAQCVKGAVMTCNKIAAHALCIALLRFTGRTVNCRDEVPFTPTHKE